MARRVLSLALFVAIATVVQAHPVPRGHHDRTITVHVAACQPQAVASLAGGFALPMGREPWSGAAGMLPAEALRHHLYVFIAYRLEVDETTVIFEDLPALLDKADFGKYSKKPGGLYQEYTRLYADEIGKRLLAKAGDRPLNFECLDHGYRLRDEKGDLLGHLRCDFVFRAAVPCKPGTALQLQFRENNYQYQEGLIDLSLTGDGVVSLKDIVAPDEALKKLEWQKRQPGDDNRLREIAVVATTVATPSVSPAQPPIAPPTPASDVPGANEPDHFNLVHLFLDAEYSIWLLLVLAVFIGAAHALTPGHGKTLVAAYLVGENGTMRHAVVLGLVTTLTHTGVVLLLALLLGVFFPKGMSDAWRANIQATLGLVMGMLVACMGFWLLMTRLAGRVDHVHLPGTGHHHHHGPGHHHHHHNPAPGQVGWGALILLGINGGIVPCWDAVAILMLAVGHDRGWLAFPVVLAFSAGLASVLVALGIIVVRVKRLASSTWGEGRLVRALPIVSAACVIVLGFYLCYDSVRAARPPVEGAAVARP